MQPALCRMKSISIWLRIAARRTVFSLERRRWKDENRQQVEILLAGPDRLQPVDPDPVQNCAGCPWWPRKGAPGMPDGMLVDGLSAVPVDHANNQPWCSGNGHRPQGQSIDEPSEFSLALRIEGHAAKHRLDLLDLHIDPCRCTGTPPSAARLTWIYRAQPD
jgi:hypothetical protein